MVTEGSCKGSYPGWRAAIMEACFTRLFRPMRVLFQKLWVLIPSCMNTAHIFNDLSQYSSSSPLSDRGSS